MAQNASFNLDGGPVGAPTVWQNVGTSSASVGEAAIPSTGQLDAFDGAFATLINGSILFNYTQNTNSGQFVFSSGASALGGSLNINNQIWVSPTLPVARALFTIANTSTTSQTFDFGMFTNLGSNASTQVVVVQPLVLKTVGQLQMMALLLQMILLLVPLLPVLDFYLITLCWGILII
jgi:hypothetical protein